MNLAAPIIERFGGIRPMARKTGISPTTIQYWKQCGYIPPRRQAAILKAALDNDIALDPADFVPRAAA